MSYLKNEMIPILENVNKKAEDNQDSVWRS